MILWSPVEHFLHVQKNDENSTYRVFPKAIVLTTKSRLDVRAYCVSTWWFSVVKTMALGKICISAIQNSPLFSMVSQFYLLDRNNLEEIALLRERTGMCTNCKAASIPSTEHKAQILRLVPYCTHSLLVFLPNT